MKKLKCTSCGSNLVIDENNEYAKCNYCGVKYKIKDELNINLNIDDNLKKGISSISKIFWIPIVVFLIILFVFVFFIFNNDNMISNNSIHKNSFDRESFNLFFNNASGTKETIFVSGIIDDIIRSNKTNERKIKLSYNETETDNENDMIEIKHSLGEWNVYEVIVDYDDEGYVNKIIIRDIK